MATAQPRGPGGRWQQRLAIDDPSMREYFQAQLDSLILIMNERDKQYDARFRAAEIAVNAALAAQEKAVAAAFLASEKAIVKAESAQQGVNERGNEFRGSLDDQAKLQMPRAEASVLFKGIEEKLDALRAAMSKSDEALGTDIKSLQGFRNSQSGGQASIRELLGYGVAVVAILAGFLLHFVR